MNNWTMAQAKRDFERGLLKEVRIIAIIQEAWAVQITSTLNVDGIGWLLDARKKEVRHMKTLDAAVAAVQEIGFEVKQLDVK